MTKKWIGTFWLFTWLLVALPGMAQDAEIPKTALQSHTALSNYLCQDLSGTEEKVRAIHQWITNNIEYDYDLITDEKPHFARTTEEIFKSRKGASAEYVILMRDMLAEQSIASELVSGYSLPRITDTVLLPVFCDHDWIAIDINGTWKLADPTLDAGYVGFELTDKVKKSEQMWIKHDAKYDKKIAKLKMLEDMDRDPEFTELMRKRQIKAQNERYAQAMKLTETIEKMPDFKDNIVFNQYPQEKYFLVSTDTFLSTHLPLNPMWQLKDDAMDVYTFCKGEKAIGKYLRTSHSGNMLYRNNIQHYVGLNAHQKLIYDAEKGHAFNPMNNKIKAENYYLVLKSFFESPKFDPSGFKENLYDITLQEVGAMMDTCLKYTSKADKAEKERFKMLNNYYKEMYKESKNMDVHQNRLITKAYAWNEKALTDMDRSWDNIERDLGKWVTNRDKMYPNLSVTYSTDNFNLKDFPAVPKEHVDSLQTMFERINFHREEWHKFMDRSSLYGIYDAQTKQNEILLKNAYFLKTMSFENNDKLRINDSIFQLKHEYVEMLYGDSLKLEMYSKPYIQSLNAFYKYVNVVIEDIKSRSDINLSDQRAASGMLTGYVLEQTKRFLNDLVEANEHFWWLEEELPNVGEFWSKLIKSSENQLVLEEERMEYITNNLEIMENREDNLLEMMKVNVKAWKVMLR